MRRQKFSAEIIKSSVFPILGFLLISSILMCATGSEAAHPVRSEHTDHLARLPENPLPSPKLQPKLAQGKFLIAGRSLKDPNFSETVVLLVNYNEQGALGIIINRPTTVKLSKLLPDIEALKDRSDTVFIGGPVARDQLMLLVRTSDKPEKAFRIFGDVFVGGKPEEIEKLMGRSDPNERYRAYAGYAGWSPGQLDREVSRGDWHISKADSWTVFDKDPAKIWPELILRFSSKWVTLPQASDNSLAVQMRRGH